MHTRRAWAVATLTCGLLANEASASIPWPHGEPGLRRQLRDAVACLTPNATSERNRQLGIHFPTHVQTQRPTVLLVHGLYGDVSAWNPLRALLEAEGYQVATFSYPSDQPLDDSARFFRDQMRAFTLSFPEMPLSVIAHSQGGLVVRAAIEPDIGRDIRLQRLILLGTPNDGTPWAPAGLLLKVQAHYDQWRSDAHWSPSWMVTDGLGESLHDLQPGSDFLRRLAQCARRPDVSYTVIAGCRNPAYIAAADLTDVALLAASHARAASHSATRKTLNAWRKLKSKATGQPLLQLQPGQQPSLTRGHAESALQHASSYSASLRSQPASSDGPVSLHSARLEGVDDLVILPATHSQLWTGQHPASWNTIRQRLQLQP